MIPYQSTTAATLSSSSPGAFAVELRGKRELIPVISAKWPPAECPITTSLLVSKPYCLAFL